VATLGVAGAVRADPALAHGVTTVAGHVTNPAVASALGVDDVAPLSLLASS
jgi:alanine dehydrogenase